MDAIFHPFFQRFATKLQPELDAIYWSDSDLGCQFEIRIIANQLINSILLPPFAWFQISNVDLAGFSAARLQPVVIDNQMPTYCSPTVNQLIISNLGSRTNQN
jgi:hypothetical protein